MTVTVKVLEKMMLSEVESLRIRVDSLAQYVDKIDTRLQSVERQLSLLTLAVEDLRVEVAWLRENCLTKQEAVGLIHSTVEAAVQAAVDKAVDSAVQAAVGEAFERYFGAPPSNPVRA